MLVHACKGSAVAASLRQQEQQAAQAGSDGVAAGGNRKLHAHAGCKHAHAHTTQPAHSHHHHRRALQQRNAPVIANAEIASGYQVSSPGCLSCQGAAVESPGTTACHKLTAPNQYAD